MEPTEDQGEKIFDLSVKIFESFSHSLERDSILLTFVIQKFPHNFL